MDSPAQNSTFRGLRRHAWSVLVLACLLQIGSAGHTLAHNDATEHCEVCVQFDNAVPDQQTTVDQYRFESAYRRSIALSEHVSKTVLDYSRTQRAPPVPDLTL